MHINQLSISYKPAIEPGKSQTQRIVGIAGRSATPMRTFHGTVPVVRAPASPVAPVAPAAAGKELKEGDAWDFTNEKWCLCGYIGYIG